MSRKIYAEIAADEEQIIKNCETNGIPDDGTISVLEHEFGWLEQSGFRLVNSILSDDDDPEDWARYIDYVMAWAFEHSSDEGCLPISTYSEWKKETGRTLFVKKLPLINPDAAAVSLVHMLGGGEPTVNGDRTTEYIDIATVIGRKAFVKAALIEEANGLPDNEKGYALHIINDIDKMLETLSDELSVVLADWRKSHPETEETEEE